MKKKIKIIFGSYWDTPNFAAFRKYKPIEIKDDSFSIFLTDKNYLNLINDISLLIVKKAYTIYLSNFLKKDFKGQDIKLIIKNHLESHECNVYFTSLVSIIISCFFEHSDKINLTSFINFNISGIKDDLYNIAKYDIATGGHYITASDGFTGIYLETDERYDFDIPEIIEIIDNEYQKSHPKDDTKHKAIMVYIDKGNIKLCDNELEEVNYEYFNKIANQDLGIKSYIDGLKDCDKETKLLMSLSLMFLIYLEVFNPTSAVLFGQIEKGIKDVLKENVEAHNENLENQDYITNFYVSSRIFPQKIK